jgi:hypothetical protein
LELFMFHGFCLMNSWQRFSPVVWIVSFFLVIVSFAVQNIFNLMQTCLSISPLISWAIGILCLYVPVFSCSSFKVAVLTFRSLVHFELIFIHSERQRSSCFSLLHLLVHGYPVFLTPFVEEAVFSWLLCQKIRLP